MKSENTEGNPGPIIARAAPAAGCRPCVAATFTEWCITTRQSSRLAVKIHEATATCRSCERRQNFIQREPTNLGKVLVAITRMLPGPRPKPKRASINAAEAAIAAD